MLLFCFRLNRNLIYCLNSKKFTLNQRTPRLELKLRFLRVKKYKTVKEKESVTCTISFQSVPDVAVKVIVTCQEEAAALRKGHRGDATDDVIVTVHHQLLVGAQVKQPAGGVI